MEPFDRDARRPLALVLCFVSLTHVGAVRASTPQDSPAVERTTTVTSVTSSSTASSSSVTTSSSLLSEYPNDLLLSVHPEKPIATLTLRVRADPDYGVDDAACADFHSPGAPQGFSGLRTLAFTDLAGGHLDRSQEIVRCSYFTHEPHGPLDEDDFLLQSISATDRKGAPVEVTVCVTRFRSDGLLIPGPGDCRGACGDAVCDGGEPTAQDALAVLRTAVGLRQCPLRLCDANSTGEVTTTDALAVLKRAVGLPVRLLCPPAACLVSASSG